MPHSKRLVEPPFGREEPDQLLQDIGWIPLQMPLGRVIFSFHILPLLLTREGNCSKDTGCALTLSSLPYRQLVDPSIPRHCTPIYLPLVTDKSHSLKVNSILYYFDK